MDKSIYRFIIRHSKAQQIKILLVTFLSLPIYYLSLDIPKRIVNGTLQAKPGEFPKALEFSGYSIAYLDHLELLFVLCGIFLGLVFLNGGYKYYINVYKGLLGERMLRRLRR